MKDYLSKTLEPMFDTITLAEMNEVKLMDRTEIKFVFSQIYLSKILDRIRTDYRIVNVDGNVIPTYKTVYYDADGLLFYSEHHRRRKERYKVRFRNYVDSSLTFLEVKHKKNGRVDKKRTAVENEKFEIQEEHMRFLFNAGIRVKDLRVKLTNCYDRITLVSKHSVERVTLDMNINFQYRSTCAKLDKVVILELKQAVLSRESPIYKVLRELQIMPYNVSKYCIGIIKTHKLETIKYNRFKKKLSRLNKISNLWI